MLRLPGRSGPKSVQPSVKPSFSKDRCVLAVPVLYNHVGRGVLRWLGGVRWCVRVSACVSSVDVRVPLQGSVEHDRHYRSAGWCGGWSKRYQWHKCLGERPAFCLMRAPQHLMFVPAFHIIGQLKPIEDVATMIAGLQREALASASLPEDTRLASLVRAPQSRY